MPTEASVSLGRRFYLCNSLFVFCINEKTKSEIKQFNSNNINIVKLGYKEHDYNGYCFMSQIT